MDLPVANAARQSLNMGLPRLAFIYDVANKFHLNGHKISCQDLYSPSYASLVGRVSGEEIETVWSYLNGFQYSTQEMSAGSRIDMLTDVINNFNLTKSIKACKCFH